MGIIVSADEIVSAPVAGAALLRAQRARGGGAIPVGGGAGGSRGDRAAGRHSQRPGDRRPTAILLGDLGERWDYALLQEAFEYLRAGAELVTCSRDRAYRRQDRLVLDAGPFVAALEYATGATALLAGKPSPVMYDAAVAGLRLPAGERPHVLMLGDDMHSDIAGAQEAGLIAWAVETGKFSASEALRAGITPDRIIPGPGYAASRNWTSDRAMAAVPRGPSTPRESRRGAGARPAGRCSRRAVPADHSRGYRRHERDGVHRQHRECAACAHAREGGGARGAAETRNALRLGAGRRDGAQPPRAGDLPRCARRHRAERQRPHPARGDEGRLEHLPDLRHHHRRRAVGGGDRRGRGQPAGARRHRAGPLQQQSRSHGVALRVPAAAHVRRARQCRPVAGGTLGRPFHRRPGGTPVLLPFQPLGPRGRCRLLRWRRAGVRRWHPHAARGPLAPAHPRAARRRARTQGLAPGIPAGGCHRPAAVQLVPPQSSSLFRGSTPRRRPSART